MIEADRAPFLVGAIVGWLLGVCSAVITDKVTRVLLGQKGK